MLSTHSKSRLSTLAVAAAVLVSLVAGEVKAQASISSTASVRTPNLLMFDPGDLINGVVRVEYERALRDWFGISLGLAVTSFRGAFTPQEQAGVIAIGPEIGAKFHFIQDAPGGLWVGPYLGMGVVAARNGAASASVFTYDLGAALGYNFILFEHFVLSIGAGGGFNDRGYGIAWAPRFRLGLGGVF